VRWQMSGEDDMTMPQLSHAQSDDLARGGVDGAKSAAEGLKPINVVSFGRCWGDVLLIGRSEGVGEDGKGDSLLFVASASRIAKGRVELGYLGDSLISESLGTRVGCQ
jgi:hypothetical protein